VHPTTQVLQVLGDELVIFAVPEPGTGLLVAFGIAIIGARRRAGARSANWM
jgi:hypothetical protein